MMAINMPSWEGPRDQPVSGTCACCAKEVSREENIEESFCFLSFCFVLFLEICVNIVLNKIYNWTTCIPGMGVKSNTDF